MQFEKSTSKKCAAYSFIWYWSYIGSDMRKSYIFVKEDREKKLKKNFNEVRFRWCQVCEMRSHWGHNFSRSSLYTLFFIYVKFNYRRGSKCAICYELCHMLTADKYSKSFFTLSSLDRSLLIGIFFVCRQQFWLWKTSKQTSSDIKLNEFNQKNILRTCENSEYDRRPPSSIIGASKRQNLCLHFTIWTEKGFL